MRTIKDSASGHTRFSFLLFVAIAFSVSALCAACALSLSAYANPADAVPPTSDGSVGIYKPNASSYRDPDDNSLGIADGEKVRDEQGRVSQLSTTTHNPYNKQIRMQIDIGSEFADFDGCDITEGYIYKVTPGGTVALPKLRAREGYYFVGWGQGGVAEEPTWDLFTTEVTVSDDTSNGRNTSIYALYSDEYGNGYCTCGAYEEGIYADWIDDIKEANARYNEENAFNDAKLPVFMAFIAAQVALIALMAFRAERRKRCEEEEEEEEEKEKEGADAAVADDLDAHRTKDQPHKSE